MSGSSGKKRLGKIFAAFTLLLLICAACVSWYMGGQTRTAEKFFSAAASGNYKNYSEAWQPNNGVTLSENGFREVCREYFTSLPEFSELSDTDIIGSKIRIKERSPMGGNITQWRLIIDADFFSSGKSISYDGLVVYMEFERGKWKIRSILV